MKKPPDSGPPKEVDFTGGIRGKYASRYREGVTIRETSPADPIALYETQSRLGNALWHAQTLEAALVAYLSLVQEMAVPEAGSRAHDLLEHRLPHTTLSDAWGSVLDAELRNRLTSLLSERNWIVHRCSFELERMADSPDRKRHIAARLEEFAGEAKYLSHCLLTSIETKLAPSGLTASEIQTRTKRVIETWAAA